MSTGFPTIYTNRVTQEDSEKKMEIVTSPSTSTVFRTTFHMFSSSARNRVKKTLDEPSEKTQINFRKFASPANVKRTGSENQLTVRDFIVEMQKAQPVRNFFSNQTYEHYNSETVINPPDRFKKYQQLSDPNRFSRRNMFQQSIQIPTEVEIKHTNRLHFASNIEDHENEKTLAIHFLGAAAHNVKHLEVIIGLLVRL